MNGSKIFSGNFLGDLGDRVQRKLTTAKQISNPQKERAAITKGLRSWHQSDNSLLYAFHRVRPILDHMAKVGRASTTKVADAINSSSLRAGTLNKLMKAGFVNIDLAKDRVYSEQTPTDEDEMNLANYGAYHNNDKIIKLALSQAKAGKLDLNKLDGTGKSFVHTAFESENQKLIASLLKLRQAQPDLVQIYKEDRDGYSALSLAAQQANKETMQALVDAREKYGKKLIDLDHQDLDGFGIVHTLVGSSDISYENKYQALEVLAEAAKKGLIDINPKNQHESPLQSATNVSSVFSGEAGIPQLIKRTLEAVEKSNSE